MKYKDIFLKICAEIIYWSLPVFIIAFGFLEVTYGKPFEGWASVCVGVVCFLAISLIRLFSFNIWSSEKMSNNNNTIQSTFDKIAMLIGIIFFLVLVIFGIIYLVKWIISLFV